MAIPGEPDLFENAMALYNEGKYLEGYTLVTEHAAEFPDFLHRSFFFRLCLMAKTGDLDQAEEILEDALDQGFFFSEFALRKDEDLAALQGRPFFEKLVDRDLLMLSNVQRNSKPLLQIIRPESGEHSMQTPFHMTLHGNSSSLKYYLPHWSFVSHTDWLTALPQSSQLGGTGIYVWNDAKTSLNEVKTHYQTVLKHNELDPQRTMISGFSMGGNIALRAALEQTFPITSFLLICPYFGELESWTPLIEAAAGKPMKGYFLLGELDESITSNARAMQKLLEDRGISSGVEVFPGIRHEFPPDFEHVFERVIHYLFP